MKKVMLIGSLMVLSGLPNIYASETPMENENMSMESRDFPTALCPDLCQKPLGIEDFRNVVLEKFFDFSNNKTQSNDDVLKVLSTINTKLTSNSQAKEFCILSHVLFDGFIDEVQTGMFSVDLLKLSTSSITYRIPSIVLKYINETHQDLQKRRDTASEKDKLSAEIKEKDAKIAQLNSEISQLREIQNINLQTRMAMQEDEEKLVGLLQDILQLKILEAKDKKPQKQEEAKPQEEKK